MASAVSTNWVKDSLFDAELSGHHLLMDLDTKAGGEDKGPRPKPLILAALSGCSGMDVVSILGKMRVPVDKCDVHVEANMTDEHPKLYDKMHVIYEFTGKNLPPEKLEKAVRMSEETYCGVGALYRKAIELTSEIIIKEN